MSGGMQIREEVESRVGSAMQKATRLEEQLQAATEAHTAAVQELRQQAAGLDRQLAGSAARESSLQDSLERLEAFAARYVPIHLEI